MSHSHFLKILTTSTVLFSAGYSPLIHAAEDIPSGFIEDTKDNTDQTEELIKLERQNIIPGNNVPSAIVSSSEAQKAINERKKLVDAQGYDLEALKADPVAFTKFLNAALAAQDMATVKELLPHYKALQVNDPMLIKFADALVYRSDGQNKKAIAIYKDMLADNPDFHPVRLNMAQALYADKQYTAAADQLQKLRGADIPPPVMASVDQLIERIQQQEQWRFSASASYVNDKNLNGVPEKQIVNAQLGSTTKPESGKGLQVSGSANKRINLAKNYYAEIGANASLKGYWDNSDYNDYLVTASTALGYDDAKNDVSISPFATKRFYGEEPYSWRKGVTVSGSRWVKPKLKMTATGMYSNETIDDDDKNLREADGMFLGLNALYIKDANEYYYGGVGRYQNDVDKTSFLSYDRNSVNVGWGKEWTQGISTLASASYAIKNFDKPSDDIADFFYQTYRVEGNDDTREDKTTSLGFQVWKRDLTLMGLTPRLVLDYEKTSSNFKYYDDRTDKTATILFTKSF
ncbi:surface lipoprotein assembly modifier [Psychrobacter sp.]|uniref:surface lipoprotein assembly modifier n=1 Tax=Psychrobacter sp. TaxID=56811 RepID=UPI0025F9AC85|nr:surface lipoprotein assembly modifier [Psychrobacter sp.]